MSDEIRIEQPPILEQRLQAIERRLDAVEAARPERPGEAPPQAPPGHGTEYR